MIAVNTARVTITVCLLSAVVEAGLACTATPRLSVMDAPIVLFMLGPYLCLAMIAWLQRGKLAASWTLLAVALGLSIWGLYVIGEDSYRYHTDANYRKLQRLAAFFVPLVQYAVVLLVGTSSLLIHLSSFEKKLTTETEPEDALKRRSLRHSEP